MPCRSTTGNNHRRRCTLSPRQMLHSISNYWQSPFRSSYVVILTLCSVLITPSLPNTVLHYSIEEELPLYTEVGNLRLDSNLSSVSTVSSEDLRFSMLGDPERDDALRYLSVNTTSSVLYINRLLNREEVCEPVELCQLTFGVAAHAGQYFHLITVFMEIEDLNDNIPTFKKEGVSIAINENSQVGLKYTLPSAIDKDSGVFGVQSYSLESTYGIFRVEYDQQVRLVVDESLDRETTGHYLLHLLAYDGGYPPNAGLLFINITVADRNDNMPVFNASTLDVSLPEDTPVPSWVTTIHAKDADTGLNGLVRYSLSDDAHDSLGHIFEVDAHTGEIYLIQELDYETKTSYSFELKAFDQGATSQISFATVNVEVLDVNDNAPRIIVTSLSNSNLPIILENSNPGVFVAHVTVSDDDSGLNGDVTCDVISDEFRLESLWGSQYQVLTAITFDREEIASYDVILTCRDNGDSPMFSDLQFKIYVGDENDNRPMFSQSLYSATVHENNAIGDTLLTIETLDLDIGENGRLDYTVQGLAAQLCYVDNTTGDVKAKVRLDYEELQMLMFNIEVRDNGIPPLSSTTVVNITVLDVNDEPPRFTSDSYVFSAPENHPGGRFVGAVSATDPDTVSPQEIRYFFQLGPDLQTSNIGSFRLNSISGQIETNVGLDREERALYEVRVSSSNSDNTSLTSTVKVTISITDENDNPPAFLYPTVDNNTVLVSGDIIHGSPVAVLQAVDPDEAANGEVSYMLMDSNAGDTFKIGRETGAITLESPPSGDGFLVYQLEIMAEDNGSPRRNTTTFFYVVINGSLTYVPTGEPYAGAEEKSNGGFGLSGSSLTAFICIVAIASVMISLLLAAIGFVLWRSRKRRQQGPQPGHMAGTVAIIATGSPENNLNNNLNWSYQSNEDTVVAMEEARLQGRGKVTQGQGQHDLISGADAAQNRIAMPSANQSNYMQVQRFLELIDSDEDSESLSNADSGNGTSLEGETPVKKRGQQGTNSRGRDARRHHSSPRRLLQMGVACPTVPHDSGGETPYNHGARAIDTSGPRACHEPIRNDCGGCQESGGSVSSDEVFESPDMGSHQPTHGILKTKIREKRLNSQLRKAQILSPSQTRVRFQPNLPETDSAMAYMDSPDLNTDRSLEYDDEDSNVIHLDHDDEMEITI